MSCYVEDFLNSYVIYFFFFFARYFILHVIINEIKINSNDYAIYNKVCLLSKIFVILFIIKRTY